MRGVSSPSSFDLTVTTRRRECGRPCAVNTRDVEIVVLDQTAHGRAQVVFVRRACGRIGGRVVERRLFGF
jgi:hypothetical protein